VRAPSPAASARTIPTQPEAGLCGHNGRLGFVPQRARSRRRPAAPPLRLQRSGGAAGALDPQPLGPRATLYFWSFTLTLQAFIQPLVSNGPAHLAFWAFWAGHTIIMASAVYDIAVLGFRPDWRDVRRVIIVSLAYVAVVTPVNLALGTNYGFIGNPPPGRNIPPFIDAMGPWPGRALIVMGLATIGFVLALLPWRFASQCVQLEVIEAGERRI
jgi:Integral membrane protein (intg_mem_TP0381)